MNMQHLAALLLSLLPVAVLQAQFPDEDSLRREQMARYVEDARSLVDFTEYMLNVLGDPTYPTSNKDEIIRFSYRKAFRDADVQVEDDLVIDRNNVTQKDVQAYLKDVTFFYKEVTFRFEIEGLTHGVTERGKPFFLLHTMRHLHGITLDGDTVHSLLPRYFEVNVDEAEQVAFIVSIYTHRIGEEEALTKWWNDLPAAWKSFFGNRVEIVPGLPLKPLLAVQSDPMVGDSLWVPETLWKTDSTTGGGTLVPLASDQFFFSLRSLLSRDSLDLSYQTQLAPLDPLSRFDQLKYLNLSHTQIVDLSPIRNLVNLAELDCSFTGVQDYSSLRYLEGLRILRAPHTGLRDLKPFRMFSQLEELEAHHTRIEDAGPLASLRELRVLDLSNTGVRSLEPLQALKKLEVLKLSYTPVENLEPLGQLDALAYLHLDHTRITEAKGLAGAKSLQLLIADFSQLASLEGLGRLPRLQRIYANGTPLSRENAMRFMRLYPEKLVIFQSLRLSRWWEGLSEVWRLYFREIGSLDLNPGPEQLQQLVNRDSLDVRKRTELADLSPLAEFIGLRILQASHIPVSSLSPLRDLLELEHLDLAYTPLNTIAALEGMPRLRRLNLAHTRVSDLSALKGQGNLQWLDISGTLVSSLAPLDQALALKYVYADSTSLGVPAARQLLAARPGCLLIFQTSVLEFWWESMSVSWQKALREHLPRDGEIDREALHTMAQLKALNLIDRPGITDLDPIRRMWNLRELRMINTRVEQLEPLSICTDLEVLVCSSGPVSDLTPLINLRKLRILDCENTPVEDLKPLANLVSLQDIRVSGTQVKDLKELEGLINLRSLSCNNTRVRSLKPIEGLPQLRYLTCYNTKIHPSRISDFKAAHPETEVVFY